MRRVSLVLLVTCLLLFVPAAAATSTSGVVVSQVFGGGGNTGAPYTHDFVELFNAGSSAVDVSGWTVQYATASGTSWQTTPLAGTIEPGRYHLVQLAGGSVGQPLPAPETTGTTNLAATSGKIALVRGGDALTCGATPGSCSANPLVDDLVGYGTASDYEGAAAAPTLSSTAGAVRAAGGCADSDVNSADFSAGAPTPRNSATPPTTCADTAPSPSATAEATVDVDVASVLSLSLERAAITFGQTAPGESPAPVSERITVVNNHAPGYALSIQRTAFAPADLPLALQASAPSGGQLAPAFAGGAFASIPVKPSSATIGTTSAPSADGGDVWPTNVGFSGPIPSVAPGRYSATLTFTVIGR